MKRKIPDIPPADPCPCCGSADLYVGPTTAATMGVQCETRMGGCGLELSMSRSDRWPHGHTGDFTALNIFTLFEAVTRWNRRAQRGARAVRAPLG